MKIKKGQTLEINDSRKGKYIGIASTDFDTVTDEWYPVHVAQDRPICGCKAALSGLKAKKYPAAGGLSNITVLQDERYKGGR